MTITGSVTMQVGESQERTNRVLIHQLNGLLRGEHKAVIGQVHKALLHIKVACELLPTDLHPQAAT